MEVPGKGSPHVVPTRFFLHISRGRHGDRTRLNNLEKYAFDCVIDAQPTECDTAGLAIVQPAARAAVSWNFVLGPSVAHRELASATLASEQAGQKGIPMFGCPQVYIRLNVVADHRADCFRAFPIDITFVRAGLQYQPFVARLSAASNLGYGAIVMRSNTGPSVGVRTAINRV